MKRTTASLAASDLSPLPESLTPSSLRTTTAVVPCVLEERHGSLDLARQLHARRPRLSEDERGHPASLVASERADRRTNGEVIPTERARARAAPSPR